MYGAVAFPGAEGEGAMSVGGRGGSVCEVTNLNDSGAGSLRSCVTAAGPRTVVFRIGGNITLSSTLTINNPYITIAGQTAPGDGITLKGPVQNDLLVVNTHNVIIRYIRVRPGPTASSSCCGETISVVGGHDIILDHVSNTWSSDQTLTVWSEAGQTDIPHNLTFQWITAGDPLNCPSPSHTGGGCHGYGPIFGGYNNAPYNITMHHSLITHAIERNPRVFTCGTFEFANNVVYDGGGDDSWSVLTNNPCSPAVNYVNNYFKSGPNTNNNTVISLSSETTLPYKIYETGTTLEGGLSLMSSAAQGYRVGTRNPTTNAAVNATSAGQAYTDVLADVGASKHLDCSGNWVPMRDAIDALDVNDTINRGGRVINMPSDVGGWPVLAAGSACTDTDHDGMPDVWETANGLNPNDPSDGNKVDPQSGYTYLEDYLGGLRPSGSTVPPVVSNGAPTGTLLAGAVQTAMSVNTDKAAICRYATSAGVPYNSMSSTFSTTGGTAHSTMLLGLTDGGNYNYYVRCMDQAGNAGTTDYQVHFSIGLLTIAAPTVTSGSPTGTLAAGTTGATLAVTTNVVATCHYATSPGVAYGSMPGVFTSTGGTSHSAALTGLANGTSYAYYVRCSDTSGNAATSDYAVGFSVASPAPPPSQPPSNLPLSLEAESAALTGTAAVESCRNCSGTHGVEQVGNYGNNPGAVTFQGITVSKAGTYKVAIYYLNGSSTRTLNVSVNGGAGKSTSFGSTGSWSTVKSVTVSVSLKAGSNTIQLYNNSSSGPDLDRIVVSQ